MPIEIIKKLLQEREARAASEKTARDLVIENERIAREETERPQKEAGEKRQKFVSQKTEIILNESHALHGLQRIENELLNRAVKQHKLVYEPERGQAILSWGANFESEWSEIWAIVNPDEDTLTICGQEKYKFADSSWQDIEAVETALAKAFVNPKSIEIYFTPRDLD